MPESSYSIRTARREEVDLAVAWAAAEGWNPGLHDAECYFAADPEGFLVGTLGDEPIATISAVRYPGGFGFLGFYIVKPEYRGRGYGLKIWNAAMQRLEGCVIGLDGVVAQQENYRKSGFDLAFRNARYQGAGGGAVPAGDGIVPLSALPAGMLAVYDAPFFPGERSRFLDAWIGQEDATALGILEGDGLAGYGVIRRCRTGHKIGPLYADRPELAERLFLALKASVGSDEAVFLDVSAGNPASLELARGQGMEVVFETARMYRGAPPSLPLARLFGITSFEIG